MNAADMFSALLGGGFGGGGAAASVSATFRCYSVSVLGRAEVEGAGELAKRRTRGNGGGDAKVDAGSGPEIEGGSGIDESIAGGSRSEEDLASLAGGAEAI